MQMPVDSIWVIAEFERHFLLADALKIISENGRRRIQASDNSQSAWASWNSEYLEVWPMLLKNHHDLPGVAYPESCGPIPLRCCRDDRKNVMKKDNGSRVRKTFDIDEIFESLIESVQSVDKGQVDNS